jgi:Lrp/AsnC family leucine-responsive transcriptional regulator
MTLDEIDRRIIAILATDARTSLKELSAQTGLSSPSVSDRLRRLNDQGVISAFTVELDPAALGYTLQAIVRIRPLPGMMHIVERQIQDTAEFTECDRVTGDDCFVARLHLRSIGQLDQILDKLADRAQTSTSIVKATPIKRRLPPLN